MNDIDKNIQHAKNRPSNYQQFTIYKADKKKKEAPEVIQARIDWQKKAFKAGGGKIDKIADGVSGQTQYPQPKKKGKAAFEQNMKELIHCKGCTEREGKPVTHPKSEFTHRPDMTRLFESTCRVEKLRRDKESARKRRNC